MAGGWLTFCDGSLIEAVRFDARWTMTVLRVIIFRTAVLYSCQDGLLHRRHVAVAQNSLSVVLLQPRHFFLSQLALSFTTQGNSFLLRIVHCSAEPLSHTLSHMVNTLSFLNCLSGIRIEGIDCLDSVGITM